MAQASTVIVNANPETLPDEWFVQPILSSVEGPREWYKSEESAIEAAKNHAVAYSCPFEVYKRSHYVYA
jgi:hypothetical protein